MTVKDLKVGDLVEKYGLVDERVVLSDEFEINEKENSFVANEDDIVFVSFQSITRIWRQNENGEYIQIFRRW